MAKLTMRSITAMGLRPMRLTMEVNSGDGLEADIINDGG